MKNTTKPGSLIAELRHITGKSQAQFAVMIGVSKDTIISVENGRIKNLTASLANKIETSTGAIVSGGKLESPFKVADYTSDDFKRWRDKFGQSNKKAALKQFDEMKTWLRIVFLAAAKSGRAGNRDRLPAVCLSFAEWLNAARDHFKLEDEIEDILDQETRNLMIEANSITALLEEPDRARKELAEHDIDFNKIKKWLKTNATDGFLFIQDEQRELWTPGRHFFSVPVRPRTLIPQARFWIKKFKGSIAAMRECGQSHPELSVYLRKIGEDQSFAETEFRRNSLKS